MRILQLIMHRRLTTFRQFAKFGIVGTGNTILDFSIYLGLTRGVPFFARGTNYLFANALSWLAAVVFSFAMNKFWTFRSYDRDAMGRQYFKFVVVSLFALLISQGLLYVFVSKFHVLDIAGKIMTIAVIAFWNFFMNKLWTFKRA